MANTSKRVFYLDWIRVLAMVGIFFFHNARFYDAFTDWHVKNANTDLAATSLVSFMSQWIMPLFFLVAGAGTYYALQSRQAGEYAQQRTLRLLVPLVFGMLVIVVPQAYFDAISHGAQLGQYDLVQIYGLYLQSLPDLNWFHLWFLVDLFIFSIITIPLLAGRRSIIARLAGSFDKPWALLPLLVISVTVVNVFMYPDGYWGYRNGGWNIITYLLFFTFGYLIFSNPRIMETLTRLRRIFLAVGIATFTFILVYVLEIGNPAFGSLMYMAGMLVQALGTWGWLLAMLGFGSLYLNRNNRFLSYANEAVLPFYILHQTVIISIGFYVVQWNAGVGLKYLVISVSSLAVIMLIYELLVKRIDVLRFLFGMRSRTRPLAPLASDVQG